MNVESSTKDYSKLCPSCGNIQYYPNKYGLERALRKNTKCYECRGRENTLSDEMKRDRALQIREYKKRWSQEHRDIIKISQKKWVKNNPDKVRNKHYKLQYGITLEQYNNLFILQEGKCKICQKHQTELNKKLCVDHNHVTGKIRGLLCDDCNIGISRFKDDISLLFNAIEYLKYEN